MKSFDIRLTLTVNDEDVNIQGYQEVEDKTMIQLLGYYVTALQQKIDHPETAVYEDHKCEECQHEECNGGCDK